jgi:hypothetical protein
VAVPSASADGVVGASDPFSGEAYEWLATDTAGLDDDCEEGDSQSLDWDGGDGCDGDDRCEEADSQSLDGDGGDGCGDDCENGDSQSLDGDGGDDCEDECEDADGVSALDGDGGDDCDDECESSSVSALDGDGDDCDGDDECEDADSALHHGDGGGDECGDACEDADSALGGGDGDDCDGDDECEDADSALGGGGNDCEDECQQPGSLNALDGDGGNDCDDECEAGDSQSLDWDGGDDCDDDCEGDDSQSLDQGGGDDCDDECAPGGTVSALDGGGGDDCDEDCDHGTVSALDGGGGDDCEDECESGTVNALDGDGGDDCEDECESGSVNALDGDGGEDCDDECEDADGLNALDGDGGEDCDDECEDADSQALDGDGGNDDCECEDEQSALDGDGGDDCDDECEAADSQALDGNDDEDCCDEEDVRASTGGNDSNNCAPPCIAANVTLDPQSVTTTYGDGNVTFTVAGIGDPVPTVKWQLSTAGSGGPWNDIAGATSMTLTIVQPTVAQSGNRYRAVLANLCGTNQTDFSADALLTVLPKTVPGAFTAANKVYDGNTGATITSRSITSGIVGGDDVTLTGGTATFDTKNVGNGKAVTGTGFALGGAQAGNYTLGTVTNTTANITPIPLTGTCTVANKVYDGTAAAAVTGSSLGSGVLSGEAVTLDSSGANSAFADPDVGNGKPVPCSGFALAGADAGNYSLTMSPTTANITPLALTGTCTAANKVYDGTTVATITGSSLGGGVLAGDTVTLNPAGASAAFNNENVGDGKPVTCNGFTLSGADAGNYTLTMSPTTANITPKPVTPSCTAADKDYDGNDSATMTGSALAGVVGSDAVTLTGGNATFDDAEPGIDKTVTCSGFTLSGADAGNYALVPTALTQATIQRPPAPAPGPEAEACLRRAVYAFIRGGKQTTRVVFFLDKKKYGTVTKRDSKSRFGVRIERSKLSNGVHVLSATVYFTKASGRKPLKLIVLKLRPCLGGNVSKEISVSSGAKGKCVSKAFLAFVKGDTISKVVYSLNGRRVRTVTVADGSGRYKIRITPLQLKAGKNVLKAKITFIRSSKKRTKTLKIRVKPCQAP